GGVRQAAADRQSRLVPRRSPVAPRRFVPAHAHAARNPGRARSRRRRRRVVGRRVDPGRLPRSRRARGEPDHDGAGLRGRIRVDQGRRNRSAHADAQPAGRSRTGRREAPRAAGHLDRREHGHRGPRPGVRSDRGKQSGHPRWPHRSEGRGAQRQEVLLHGPRRALRPDEARTHPPGTCRGTINSEIFGISAVSALIVPHRPALVRAAPFLRSLPRNSLARLNSYRYRLCSSGSCVSSVNTISSNGTLCARSNCTSPVVCENCTFRSSSPWTSSTGDFQVSIAAIVDDSYDTLPDSSELPHRWTPAMSTPALKMSDLRASACDVSTPPYDTPQIPTRFGSTSGRDCRYFP